MPFLRTPGGTRLHLQVRDPPPELSLRSGPDRGFGAGHWTLNDPHPEAVILLHGLLLGSVASWYFSLMPALAKRRRVLAYDLKGHGRSDRPAQGYGLQDHLADLEAICAWEQIQSGDEGGSATAPPLSLVGHSYGALIALGYALAHPDRVKHLVLVELPLPPSQLGLGTKLRTSPEPSVPSTATKGEGLAPAAMLAMLPPSLRAQLFGPPSKEGYDAKEDTESNKGEATGGAVGAPGVALGRRAARFLDALRALSEDTDLLARLAEETGPSDAALRTLTPKTLLVYGEDSSCRTTGEKLAALIPNAFLTLLPGGHFLPSEQSAALSELICDWFEGASPSQGEPGGAGHA